MVPRVQKCLHFSLSPTARRARAEILFQNSRYAKHSQRPNVRHENTGLLMANLTKSNQLHAINSRSDMSSPQAGRPSFIFCPKLDRRGSYMLRVFPNIFQCCIPVVEAKDNVRCVFGLDQRSVREGDLQILSPGLPVTWIP